MGNCHFESPITANSHLAGNFPGSFFSLEVFKPTYFAVRFVLNLFGSPGDLLFSSVVLLLASIGLGIYILTGGKGAGALAGTVRKPFQLILDVVLAAAAGAAAVLLFFSFEDFLRQTVANSNLELRSFSPLPVPPSRLIVIMGLYFLYGSFLFVLFDSISEPLSP